MFRGKPKDFHGKAHNGKGTHYVWIGTGGRRTRYKYDRERLFGTLDLMLEKKATLHDIEDAIVLYGGVNIGAAKYIAQEYNKYRLRRAWG